MFWSQLVSFLALCDIEESSNLPNERAPSSICILEIVLRVLEKVVETNARDFPCRDGSNEMWRWGIIEGRANKCSSLSNIY